jgi:quercetin dioxygenase-like cupin family protein
MTAHRRRNRLAGTMVFAVLAGCHTAPLAISGRDSNDRTALSHALPSLDGGQLRVTVVEVTYGPGGSSPPHSHPCAVIGYVVEGALRTQVKDEPVAIHRAGESFYEEPDGVHLVSANASDKERVRFIAYFTCDHDTPLSVAVPEAQTARGQQP